ncbi:ABC transporter permease [Ruegeria sp. 2012CJ41-6]|uniref:ABC transporter permease n=1 Tax=Ruegeria spongiae TaxID=2942209 RepID=A0ABT0Q894_9RHOB|nr:ABC transporter permease [Ruegeria spongiae]MCL6286094.1 ABC transporter permease [Ruegeria spongiae]
MRLVALRITAGLLLILAISAFLFLGLELLPGDFAQNFLGQTATPESVAAIRQELGLDVPAVSRYLGWLQGVATGDFGESWANRKDVNEQLFSRFANTFFLASTAALVAVPLALFLGVVSVHFHNKFPDHAINIVSLAAISMPDFFVGYLLIFFFALVLGVGYGPPIVPEGPLWTLQNLELIALPVMTLVIVVLAHMMRMTKAALLNVMESPYIETAELKGVRPLRVIWKHAAPNTIAPIANVVALNMAYLVVGVVVIEVVFAYPGMGQYFIDAVTIRDMPVVQACGIVFSAVYVILNMLADIISIIANPRLMHPK